MDLDTAIPFRGSHAVRHGALTWGLLDGPGFRKLGPDTFVGAHVADSPLLSLRALLTRAGPDAVATGWSACLALGLDVAPRQMPTEITALGRRLPPGPGEVVRQQLLPDGESLVRDGIGTTTALRTALDLARRTTSGPAPGGRSRESLVDVVVACDALARAGEFTGSDLATFALAHPRLRGVLGVGRVADLVEVGSDSPPETRVRVAIVLAGLPRPFLQFPVPNGGVRPFLLDLAWPEFRVALEYDGHDHALADRRGRDLDRLETLRRAGWLVIVATSRQLRRPGWAPDRVREALLSRGWTPDPQAWGRVQPRRSDVTR